MTRRIIVHMMMSVDGFVASAASGDESWMLLDPQRDQVSLAIANQVELALIGHGAYHDMVAYWPEARGDTDTQRAYIERINPMPKLVVTRQPVDLAWNASALVVNGEGIASCIRELKSGNGGDVVVWGGATLVQALTAHDLVDEYQLIVQPVALGSGAGLFADIEHQRQLRLIEATAFNSSAVFVRYQPNRNPEGKET